MGELQHEAFQFAFNGFLKVAFQGSRVTSDAGLLLVRELDERLGLEALISEHLSDSRQGLNTQFSLAWRICCGSRSIAGLRATKTSTTRCACRRTRRFASSGRRRSGIAVQR